MRRPLFISIYLIAIIMVVGCGVSKRKLKNAEARIESLKEKGVPDTLLSRASVFLYQARDSKSRGNRGLARSSADSMMHLIEVAEDYYKKSMEELRPVIDSLLMSIAEVETTLTGMQKHALDSQKAIIDSFLQMDWLIQAEGQARETAESLPVLIEDEKKAADLAKFLPGRWEYVADISSDVFPQIKAVEKKIFHFYRNGKAKLIESKKGRTAVDFIEDWQFVSTGTWDCKGDTIHLLIDQFKARQNFKHLKDGRWVADKHPAYDSTITDGSQDRTILRADLDLDFRKKARY